MHVAIMHPDHLYAPVQQHISHISLIPRLSLSLGMRLAAHMQIHNILLDNKVCCQNNMLNNTFNVIFCMVSDVPSFFYTIYTVQIHIISQVTLPHTGGRPLRRNQLMMYTNSGNHASGLIIATMWKVRGRFAFLCVKFTFHFVLLCFWH